VTPRDDGWLTTAEAAVILDRSPHTVGDLARAGQLPSMRRGRQLLVSEVAVRERAEQAAQWVSYLRATEIVGCSETAILHAVQRGDIERRMSRVSVENFAGEWATRRAERDRRRAQREAPGAPARLGISLSRLRQLAVDERVPFMESGGRRWYRRDHIERIAAARSFGRLEAIEP
jgi:excisionase family DNA binding protein